MVGRNDAGKSTIMDALDIFLNDGSPDKDDACKFGDPKDMTITCIFSDLPESVVLDQTTGPIDRFAKAGNFSSYCRKVPST